MRFKFAMISRIPRIRLLAVWKRSVYPYVAIGALVGSLLVTIELASAEDPIPRALPEAPQKPERTEKEASEQRAANLPDGINDGFLNPEMNPEEYIQRFEIESREVFACRAEILKALQLTPGHSVADIGAGTGLFLQPLSNSVGPEGHVFAVEIAPSFIKHLRDRARKESLENVEVVFCSDRHANLPKNSVDRMVLCDVYHHFEYPRLTMDSLWEAMREGGLLVLVDFHREPPGVSPERTEWLKGHVRAPQEVFRAEIEQAGFVFRDEVAVEGFQENYLLRFDKPRTSNP
jgi:cyclopropane fatty-acyl-phospholipid synthase-like methyltransferase